jgi:uncharacterized protein (TIGR00369 family)
MTNPKLTARQIRDFLPRIPFNTLLGVKLTRLHRDGVTIECEMRHELTNSAGVAHGGVAAAMADVAVGMAVNRHFGGKRPLTTVEMKINYFRPVTQDRIFARSRLLRIGSTLCVGSVNLTDADGDSIGTALVTYILLDARGTRPPERGTKAQSKSRSIAARE